MRVFGTDVVAVACILGGAAVGGVGTMALLSAQEHAQVEVGVVCAVEAVTAGPQIVVTRRGDANAVIMSTPHIRIHSTSHRDCVGSEVSEVTVHLEEALHEVEEARAQIITGVRRAEIQERMLKIQEAHAQEAEARLDQVMVILEKAEKGSGGQI